MRQQAMNIGIVACSLCLLTVTGCGSQGSTEPTVPGFSLRTFVDATGRSHRYAIFVPYQQAPAGGLPVIMYLNGHGENGDDGVLQLSANFGSDIWERRDHFPFLAVFPQCRKQGNWTVGGDDEKRAMRILDEVIKEFAADDDRVYLIGVSAGGAGAWEVGSAHADRFAAVVPLCGIAGDAAKLAECRMPIWYFVNEGDDPALVDRGRRFRKELLATGLSPRFSELRWSGHDCWTIAFAMPELYGWLREQRRSANLAGRLFEHLPATRLLAEWEQTGSAHWRIGEDASLIANSEEGEGQLVSPPLQAPAEIHGEFWLDEAAAYEFELTISDDANKGKSVRFIVTPPQTGAAEVRYGQDGGIIVPLTPASQQSLRVDAWNDVRFRIADDKVTVNLNCWKAAECPLVLSAAKDKRVRCALTASGKDAIRWRDIRWRTIDETSAPLDGSDL